MQFDNGSTVTIDGGTTGGTITIAEQDANGKFDRIIKSYSNLKMYAL